MDLQPYFLGHIKQEAPMSLSSSVFHFNNDFLPHASIEFILHTLYKHSTTKNDANTSIFLLLLCY
jgi:hypothetical protein